MSIETKNKTLCLIVLILQVVITRLGFFKTRAKTSFEAIQLVVKLHQILEPKKTLTKRVRRIQQNNQKRSSHMTSNPLP